MHFNKHTRFRSNYIRSQPYVNLSNNSHEIISTLSIVYTVKIKYSRPLYSPAYVLALSLMFKMFRPLGMIFTHTHTYTLTHAQYSGEKRRYVRFIAHVRMLIIQITWCRGYAILHSLHMHDIPPRTSDTIVSAR